MEKIPILNVVMVPWLAHGHVSPYLELAKRLSTRNFQIYLCSTPVNLAPIKKRVATHNHKHSPSIQLIELHIPSQPDLPPHFHTTNGLPPHLHSTLERAMDMASPSFIEIIRTLKPDIIINDFNQQWATTAAASLGIPAAPFIISNASIICYINHTLINQGIDFPFPGMILRGSYWNHKFQNMVNKAVNINSGQTQNASPSKPCNIIFVRSLREIEGKYMEYLAQLHGIKIIPTGPLLLDTEEDGEDKSEIMEWLNKKETLSTVFVSFGTESFLSREEILEIAKGLELSPVNFIWVLRFSFDEKDSTIGEVLPNGFLERVGDRGLVVDKLVPQARILRHPNVGGFVSHCGWGSTIEAMGFGVPIVGIPINYDHPFSAKLVEEIGMGMEVGRDLENGRLSGENIAECIKEVVMGENGKKRRDKAREMRELIKSKREEDMDGVVEELWKLHNDNIAVESKA